MSAPSGSTFRAAFDPEEWSTSGLDENLEGPVAACFVGSRMVAGAGESNLGAVRVARKVGYDQYATHLAVRLKRDAKEE